MLLALEIGCLFAIDSDAHAPGQLDMKAYGCERAERLGVPVGPDRHDLGCRPPPRVGEPRSLTGRVVDPGGARLRRCGGRVLRGRARRARTSTSSVPRSSARCRRRRRAGMPSARCSPRTSLLRARMASRSASSRTSWRRAPKREVAADPGEASAATASCRLVGPTSSSGSSASGPARRGRPSSAPSPKDASTAPRMAPRSMPSDRSASASSSSSGRRPGRPRRAGRVRASAMPRPRCRGRRSRSGRHRLLGQGQEKVRRAHLVGAVLAGDLLCGDDGGAHLAGQAFEHGYLRACLRWTVCLVTPRESAMSCHDQPLARALRTCRASSCSSSRLRAATARSPTGGSVLSRSPARSVAVRGHGRQHMLTAARRVNIC